MLNKVQADKRLNAADKSRCLTEQRWFYESCFMNPAWSQKGHRPPLSTREETDMVENVNRREQNFTIPKLLNMHGDCTVGSETVCTNPR